LSDIDLFALHYVFVPINSAVAGFVEAYSCHDLCTEQRGTPLMIWTNGIISSSHASDTAIQDFVSGNIDSFGEDPEGPESNEFDQGDIQIPITEVNLSEEGLQQLHLEDPLQSSPNYGIDVYLRVRDLIRRPATRDS